MQKFEIDKLDFAYKYPFSDEAREIISKAEGEIDDKYLNAGKLRVEKDILGNSEFSNVMLVEIKYTYVLSYVYSRMLVSAINNKYYLGIYVNSEARRSRNALEKDTFPNLMKVTDEFHVPVNYVQERFVMPFAQFLLLSPKTPDISLVHLELDKGMVYLFKEQFLSVLETAMANEIRKKLPIPSKELPKRITLESKSIKVPEIKVKASPSEGSYRWIDKILATPIGDVRHRTVNLVLAPYLTNIKGLSEEDATKIIVEYIEKCKTINPDTKVNISYIRYQCKYAKAKGMKPLSLDKAKELYSGVLEFD